jgi:hypothetical protein
MLRIALLLAALAVALPLTAEAAPPVQHFPQQTTLGFYRGKTIEYLDFGPLKVGQGAKVAPIWVVTNGVEGQVNIVDTVPGRKDYTPLWSVEMVTFRSGVKPRLLKSKAMVDAAVKAGQVTVKMADVVVNCPVI